MHPENTPLLGHGQLFLKEPTTGQTVPLGYTMAEITLPEPEQDELAELQAVRRINNTLPEISIDLEPTPEFDAWLHNLVEAYKAWLAEKVEKAVEDCRAWAQANRPEWLHIMRRTKKKRTRKKYAQRITREYVATAKAAGALVATGLTVNEARQRLGLPLIEED